MIHAESFVSNKDHEGYVRLEWGKQKGKLNPAEARMFAMTILACAEAAESDAFLINFLMQKVEMDFERAILIMRDFREYRDKQAEKQTPPILGEPPRTEPSDLEDPSKPSHN